MLVGSRSRIVEGILEYEAWRETNDSCILHARGSMLEVGKNSGGYEEDMNDSKPLISVVVPVYNVEKYLNSCINSIANQTYENIEVLLVDNGSRDSSELIIDKWVALDKRVVKLLTVGGVSIARNAGIDKANGEFICFVDADDYINPCMIEKLYDALVRSNTDLAICGYTSVFRSKKNKRHCFLKYGKYTIGEYLRCLVKHPMDSYYGGPVCKLYKLKKTGMVHFEEGENHAEDWVFNVRILKEVREIAVVSDSLYYYRADREGSLTKEVMKYSDIKRRTLDMVSEFSELCDEYWKKEKNILMRMIYGRFISTLYRRLAVAIVQDQCMSNDKKKESFNSISYEMNKKLNAYSIKPLYSHIGMKNRIVRFAGQLRCFEIIKFIYG